MSDFTFPENKAIFRGTLKNYEVGEDKKVRYSEIDITNPVDNLINIDGIDYYFTYLNKGGRNKGGNSIILKLFDSQSIEVDDIQYGDPDMILKILKTKKSNGPLFEGKLEKRFHKEILALERCKSNGFQNVIEIYDNGTCRIFNPFYEKFDEYLFYCMEYANHDLKSYVEESKGLSMNEKISLCLSLAQGLKELQSLGFYHRDIKPDNIFIVNEIWKIGDLGLIAERNEDDEIDGLNDFIGPRGWHSPETMNKYLCEGKGFEFKHDCIIDHQSDIFQLGKVFWYVIQHNAPTGAFKQQDTFIKRNELYALLRTMLNYSKKKRYNSIDEIIRLLRPIELDLSLAS